MQQSNRLDIHRIIVSRAKKVHCSQDFAVLYISGVVFDPIAAIVVAQAPAGIRFDCRGKKRGPSEPIPTKQVRTLAEPIKMAAADRKTRYSALALH
jgi:hypothetical protein